MYVIKLHNVFITYTILQTFYVFIRKENSGITTTSL